ncbi:GNAT family N-acetyltransferase [Phormidesmis priestleyi]
MINLRPATFADLDLLQHWDEQPHIIDSDPNDDWHWEIELDRTPEWREQLIVELKGRPIGFIQIIDPALEESHYWGEVPMNLRAIDIWIGEATDLGKGYGTTMMQLALARCFADPLVTAVLIDPLASNTRAHRFYKRLGFQFVEPRRFGEDDCFVYRLNRADWHSERVIASSQLEIKSNQKQIPDPGAQIKMHEGEIDIDIAIVNRLLAEQFPHLAERSITVVRSTGTVNAIYRLDNDLYVRLPRVETSAESIDREWTWVPKLAPRISVTIPQPLARGKPTNWYPCPWAIYHWIKGSPYRDDLIRDERQAALDLANFILELRKVDVLGAPRGGRNPLIELDTATRSAIKSSHGVIDIEAASAAWIRSLEAPLWNGKPVWIHGDLLRPNFLVQDGRLCAVIDFGGVGIGDPAADVIPA